MGKKLCRQIRVSGVSRSGVRVFYALDVPLNLKTDLRGSEYLAARSKAITNFHRKHPGSRVTGLRNMQFIEGDAEW